MAVVSAPDFKANGSAFLATLIAFIVLDAAWLMLVAIKIFQTQLGPILRPEPMFAAALLFYVVYAFGLVILAVRPGLDARSAVAAAVKGAVVGLTAYATFDLTNLAIVKGWTICVAIIDIAWGVVVSSVAALAGYAAGSRVQGLLSRPAVRTR